MTVPFWCLLLAVLIPYVLAFSRLPYLKELGGPDVNEPRAQSAKLTGKGGRIVAAQANAWEALAIFAPAVIVNHLAGADTSSAAAFAVVWVVARIAHGLFYINGLANARSGSFVVALICVLGLFVQAARA